MWAMRCQHEASTWSHNAFLTLTYDDEHLPWHGSLDRAHPTRFIRYLRRAVSGVEEAPDGSGRRPVRFFGCGEYGSQRSRAHYHLLLFNVRFDDVSRYGEDTYTSELVSRLWPEGSHLLGKVTPASAAYVAGYATKKVSKWKRDAYGCYQVVDRNTGEVHERKPEFPMMSLKPAIGQYWYDRYKEDLRHGFVLNDGRQVAIPRVYRDKLKRDDPQLYEEMQFRKYEKAKQFDPADRTEARLAVREQVAQARKQFFSTPHLED